MGNKEQREGSVVVAPRSKTHAQKPPLYKVLLHNDDFTPRDLVVMILIEVFGLGEGEAGKCMLHAHNNGLAVVGIYIHEIAESKVKQAMAIAHDAQVPLRFTFEPED